MGFARLGIGHSDTRLPPAWPALSANSVSSTSPTVPSRFGPSCPPSHPSTHSSPHLFPPSPSFAVALEVSPGAPITQVSACGWRDHQFSRKLRLCSSSPPGPTQPSPGRSPGHHIPNNFLALFLAADVLPADRASRRESVLPLQFRVPQLTNLLKPPIVSFRTDPRPPANRVASGRTRRRTARFVS
jgi:hypothetical protein